MGNDLHRFPQVVATPFLGDDGFVDASRGAIVVLTHPGMAEALVVAEVKVGFGAVIGDEDFAVLKRAHGSRINVQVRIQFQKRDLKSRAPRANTPSKLKPRPLPSELTTPPVTKMYFGTHDPP